MRLDNLITIFFNQPHVLTTSIKKETTYKKITTYIIWLTILDRFKECLILYIVIYY